MRDAQRTARQADHAGADCRAGEGGALTRPPRRRSAHPPHSAIHQAGSTTGLVGPGQGLCPASTIQSGRLHDIRLLSLPACPPSTPRTPKPARPARWKATRWCWPPSAPAW
ncbi:hypothetical protein DZC73_23090 [Albitalea terrae]|uniref:Uncharacterized protein n=1 Tax=Piscinibacter terrae TaxID=2496871 RepID=A0A3N7IUK0_9BURK|nr:hypothetical protein DZC73_23090 [Albitalea terrae]